MSVNDQGTGGESPTNRSVAPAARLMDTVKRRFPLLERIPWLPTPAGLAFSVALIVLFGMFFSVGVRGADPDGPRGDGTYKPLLARGDGHLMFLMTQSLVFDRDVIYDNQLKRFGDPFRQPRTKTGRQMIPHPIGPSLAQVPAFVIAHGTSKVANVFGAEIASHGYTTYHQRWVLATSVLAGFGAVVIGFLAARRWLGGQWAPLYAAISVLFGSSITYYAAFLPSYAHAIDALACSAFLGYWMLTVGNWHWKRFAILGALLGMAALVRVTGFGLGAVVLIEVLARLVNQRRGSVGESTRAHAVRLAQPLLLGALALAVAILFFSPQLITWKLVFGDWVTSPMGPKFIRLGEPEWIEFLFSSRNGWLSAHPIALFGCLGLFVVPARMRMVAAALLVAVVIQVYVNSCVFDWWSGASFGQRRMCSVTFINVIGLASLLRATSRLLWRLTPKARHALAVLILGWFVVWNVGQSEAELRVGATATGACCRGAPPFQAWLAKPIFRAIGNPVALPISAIHSLRFGVPLNRWSLTAGNYADHPDLRLFNQDKHRRRSHRWGLGSTYLTGGFGARQADGKRPFRWTTEPSAGVLLPLFIANESRTVSFELAPNVGRKASETGVEASTLEVQVLVNDVEIFRELVGAGWKRYTAQVSPSELRRGFNHLEFRALPTQPVTTRPMPPLFGRAAGVAVAGITLGYPISKPARKTKPSANSRD